MTPHPPPQPIIGYVIIIGVLLAFLPVIDKDFGMINLLPSILLIALLLLVAAFWPKGVLSFKPKEVNEQ